MPQNIRLWEIPGGQPPLEIKQAKLDLESRLEEWLEKDISLLSDDLLVIGKQVPTDFGGYIDLLCLNGNADTVIVELKRDKTPREVTAQALDYASWVVDLTAERIGEIANEYLGARGPLEVSFRSRFDTDLPEILNQSHKMLIVASSIDASSERIINYLSDTHGVDINAVTFQYFRLANGTELLGRVFLIAPAQVAYKAQAKGMTRRRLTLDEFQQLAEQNGVGDLFHRIVELFQQILDEPRPRKTLITFKVDRGDKRIAILNLIPQESSSEAGVFFQLYSSRFAERFGLQEPQIKALLPSGIKPWKYTKDDTPDFSGYSGYFKNAADVQQLLDGLSAVRPIAGVVG